MKKYPLRLSYISKPAIWSGTRLVLEWGKQGDGGRIAETWELSVRDKEMATVRNGEAASMTLRAYIERCGSDCVSPQYRLEDRFPLLVKLIDAGDRLSVQVHPDDAYAERVERDSGKTEMWYIVDAEPEAAIIYGLRDGVSREDFAKAVEENRIGETMRSCPVRAGEAYFIPAGLVHAIGKGILIAEIQQNSDLTYRIYDYDRRQADGSLRELHTDKALAVVRPFTDGEIESIRFAKGRGDASLLVNSEYFSVRKQTVSPADGAICLTQGTDSFTSLLCIEGEGVLTHDETSYPIRRGDSYFLPAGMGDYTLRGTLTLIAASL